MQLSNTQDRFLVETVFKDLPPLAMVYFTPEHIEINGLKHLSSKPFLSSNELKAMLEHKIDDVYQIEDGRIRNRLKTFIERNDKDSEVLLPIYHQYISQLEGDDKEMAEQDNAFFSWRSRIDSALCLIATQDQLQDSETYRRLVIELCNKMTMPRWY